MSRISAPVNDASYDHIAIALDKYEQRADEIRRMLSHLYTIHENYTSLYTRLLSFQDKLKHTTFIPFGSHAFIPGQIVSTSQLTVYLGEGYYREMSTNDTIKLVEKRLTGLQNEINTHRLEMQSFGHHIQHLYSILGKPLHIPTMSDKIAEKLTGVSTSLNTIDISSSNDLPQDHTRTTKGNLNPRDPTAALQITRATRTNQGKNEEGDDIIEIIEYLEDDMPSPSHMSAQSHINSSKPSSTKAYPDIPDFLPQDYTMDEDGQVVLTNPDKAPIQDVFYESLDRTLRQFETARVSAQDLDQDEIDEIERIEREIMGDLYVPPTTTATITTSSLSSSKQKKITNPTQNDSKSLFDDIFMNGTGSEKKIDTKNQDQLAQNNVLFFNDNPEENELILDEVLIPTARSHVPQMTADDFRHELTMPSSFTTQNSSQTTNKKSSLIEILDDDDDDDDDDDGDGDNADVIGAVGGSKIDQHIQTILPSVSAQDNANYDDYYAYLDAFSKQQTQLQSSTDQNCPKSHPSSKKDSEKDPQPILTPQTTIPSPKPALSPKQDRQQLIGDVVAVRQRPGRKTTTLPASTASPDVIAVKTTQIDPEQPPTKDNNTPNNSILSDSISEPSTSDIYHQYMSSLQNNTVNDFFAQFLETMDDEDDDLGLYEDYDEDGQDENNFNDEDDEDDEYDDFYANMNNIYTQLSKQPTQQQNQSNTQNNSFRRKNQSSSSNMTNIGPHTTSSLSTNPNIHDDTSIDSEDGQENDAEYMNLFWNHMQSIVDEQEQNDMIHDKQASLQSSLVSTHLDDIDMGTELSTPTTTVIQPHQHPSLPPQDRPIYSTFGLGQLRDGSHALVTKSMQSTTYTSDLLTKKKGPSQTPTTSIPSLSAPTSQPYNQQTNGSTQTQKKMSLFKQKRLGLLDENQ